MNRLSKIFQPINKIPKNAEIKNKDVTSKSQRLMLDLGIIRSANPGNFHLLPLGLRALDKLRLLIDEEMHKIGGQKLMLPSLTQAALWKKKRLNNSAELFKLVDRHKNTYILSKRFGLLRGREFLMKDLYTFDTNLQSAKQTYIEISDRYNKIFRALGIEFVQVCGATGTIGGLESHKFHYTADVGEDKLLTCTSCGYKGNTELLQSFDDCPNCKSKEIVIKNGIEVGHTFLLGDKYSDPLKTTFLAQNGKPENLQMGCYGLGVSRILAAALEVLSWEEELRWPVVLAPYKVVIIPPKDGSKEELATTGLDEHLYQEINKAHVGDVLLDDRRHLTIGKRVWEARRMGYPYIVVIGTKATETPPLYELNEVFTDKMCFLDKNELLKYLNNKQ